MKNFILIYSRHYKVDDMPFDTKDEALEFSHRQEELGMLFTVLIIDLRTSQVVWRQELISDEAIEAQAKRVLINYKPTT